MIRVIVLRPLQPPVIEEIEPTLEGFYSICGKYIETLRLTNDLDVYFNEEGSINGMPKNRRVGRFDIYGPIVIARNTPEGETVGLTDDDLAEWLPKTTFWPMFVTN